jgi:REP element-mobilizing transposase RayT
MARPLRIEMADGLYHVTVRGWERRVIVDSDRDREDWLRLLDRVVTRSHWRVFSWVLMSNHFHIFLRTPEPNLSAGMHDLNSGYASLFNRRYRRSGSLFRGRFKAILVEDPSHAWELSRFVHLNPVRAKMVQLPQQYRWSSYLAYRFVRDAATAPAWLDWETVLREHSEDLRNARRSYQRFVEAGIREPPRSPLNSAAGGVFLGKASWVEQMRQRLADMPEDTNVPQRHQLAWRPERADILGFVQDHFGVESRDLQQIRRHGNDARVAAIYLIRRLTSEKVMTLAQEFGGVSVAAISKLLSRAELRRQKDPHWNNLLEELERKCWCQPCSIKLKVKT